MIVYPILGERRDQVNYWKIQPTAHTESPFFENDKQLGFSSTALGVWREKHQSISLNNTNVEVILNQ